MLSSIFLFVIKEVYVFVFMQKTPLWIYDTISSIWKTFLKLCICYQRHFYQQLVKLHNTTLLPSSSALSLYRNILHNTYMYTYVLYLFTFTFVVVDFCWLCTKNWNKQNIGLLWHCLNFRQMSFFRWNLNLDGFTCVSCYICIYIPNILQILSLYNINILVYIYM